LEFDGKAGVSYAESLALFGFPLSEPQMEQNTSGDNVLTQYFERARFEDHGASGVLLGLLGNETRSYSPDERFSRNYVGTVEQGGVRLEVARILIANKTIYADQFAQVAAFANYDQIGEIIFRVTNVANETRTIYPLFGSVVVNSNQIDLESWYSGRVGANVGGDILPGATKVGGTWFGIRTKVPDVSRLQIVVDPATTTDYKKAGGSFKFDIDLSHHTWEPLPTDLR
jgi:hypothetical protein